MLSPDRRELLIDALQSPEGYRFDRGLATTFTLDLLTLLVAPLSLALLDVSDSIEALSDPLLLLEGLRRYASRIAIFCQAGRIAIPPPHNYLYSFLEKSIVQVKAPYGGVFHPKVWLLRYEPEAEGRPILYRLLNLSRNLTFDRSWDLILRLEGELVADRVYAFGRNNPLGDLLRALPEMAVQPIEPGAARDLDLLEHEVRRVAFRSPAPFEDHLAFHPSGIPGHRWGYRFRQGAYGRAMVISPFLSNGLLRKVAGDRGGHVLISRADSLAAVSHATLSRFRAYTLDDAAAAEPEPDAAEAAPEAASEGQAAGESGPVESVGEEMAGARPDPSGLHAKLYVLESGARVTWLVGSANATNAAFKGSNVELMVGLQGPRTDVGIDRVLGAEDDENALSALLRAYAPGEQLRVEDEQWPVESLADAVRSWLIDLPMRLEAARRDADQFDLILHCDAPEAGPPEGEYSINCWPITLRPDRAVILQPERVDTPVVFENLALLSLTAFVAFQVMSRIGDRKHALRFVLGLPITGIPAERRDRLYAAIIEDRGRFLRYLWIMLLGDEASQLAWGQGLGGEEVRWSGSMDEGRDPPLLEALVRALSRSPQKIDRVAEIVDGLRRTPEGQEILSESFERLWLAIEQARSDVS